MCLIDLESLVEETHPIREVKRMCQEVLTKLDRDFTEVYAPNGRPSVPPERLLMAWVLMALFSVRSCRLFAAQLRYNFLFKWFLDMEPDEDGFDASTFSKNMERFEQGHLSEQFFRAVVDLADRRGWVSNEHFSADGTLIESWASLKSFRPKGEEPPPPGEGRNDWVDFKGEKRSNDTHESTTDPEAKLLRKGAGKEAKLCFGAHAVTENRNGLLVHFTIRPSVGEGCTEPEVADQQLDDLAMLGMDPKTVGADRGYHTKSFVQTCLDKGTEPHVALVKGRVTPGLDEQHTRREGYRMSQRARKRVEEPFGWMKTTGLFRKSRWVGLARTAFVGMFVAASCNLVRMANLAAKEAAEQLRPPAVDPPNHRTAVA